MTPFMIVGMLVGMSVAAGLGVSLDFTAAMAPVYWGMVAMLVASGLAILAAKDPVPLYRDSPARRRAKAVGRKRRFEVIEAATR